MQFTESEIQEILRENQKLKQDLNDSKEELEATVRGANEDAGVHGILIFRPLPKHLSEEPLKALIAPEKDVDCFGNAGMQTSSSAQRTPIRPVRPRRWWN